MMSDDAKNPSVIKMPILNGHKMTVIKDEATQGQEYFDKLNEAQVKTYRLEKTLIRPPQEFCGYEQDDFDSKVIKVLETDLHQMIEETKAQE